MLQQLVQPVIFAHRGASAYAPENTLAAFELAARQGAEAIELDAKICGSGEVVVIHDQTVKRTTGTDGHVGRMALAALKELDAGAFFGEAFVGEKIPTLAEVFEAVGRRLYINVELTNYASPTDTLPEKVAVLVKQHGLEERVMFSSFNPLALIRINHRLPAAPLGLLAFPGGSGAWARSRLGELIPHQALHPEKNDVSAELVERVHRGGRRVHVYTVNDEEVMRKLFAWQVDGIFTDDPPLAQQVRAGLGE
jgi:glycerophosphoryl diester phosphodiesterase